MKKYNKIIVGIIVFLIAIVLCYPKLHFTYANSSCSEIVMELNSNRILFENNCMEKKYMASTTKILTAITIIENCDVNEIVHVTEKTVGVEGSSIYLQAGEKLSVKHLLYGLMLRSGNDCAETLAVHCSKSIEEFSLLMNDTAKKIGALNSNFVNPHGLHEDNHYTTAYDLALISAYAMKNETFREIVGTKSIKIPFTTQNTYRYLINKNKLLKDFEGTTGIKTGYTKKAGRCLVSSCVRDGMELICVVLNCPPMFERSKNLLTDCFNNYKLYKLVESDNIIDFIQVEKGDDIGVYVKKDIILPLSEFEYHNIDIIYDLPQKLEKPLKKDSEIGKIKICCQNKLLFSEKIYTIVDN